MERNACFQQFYSTLIYRLIQNSSQTHFACKSVGRGANNSNYVMRSSDGTMEWKLGVGANNIGKYIKIMLHHTHIHILI